MDEKTRMIALAPDKFGKVSKYLSRLTVPMNRPALLAALEVLDALSTAVDIELKEEAKEKENRQ